MLISHASSSSCSCSLFCSVLLFSCSASLVCTFARAYIQGISRLSPLTDGLSCMCCMCAPFIFLSSFFSVIIFRSPVLLFLCTTFFFIFFLNFQIFSSIQSSIFLLHVTYTCNLILVFTLFFTSTFLHILVMDCGLILTWHCLVSLISTVNN